MSEGDKIPCATLDEALKHMDELMCEGWNVDMECRAGCKPILTVKGRTEE